MTTTQTTAKKSQPAKKAPAPAAKKAPAPAPAKKAAEKPAEKKEPKAPAVPAYREATDFGDALKTAKSAAKDNAELKASLQLITHLSWKTPGGEVSWANGTTQSVVDYATDLGIGPGTPVPDAMDNVLGVAEKAAAGDKATKEPVDVLAKIIRGHKG